ncbi:hypothetical protein RJ640_000803 [Escallonia rubra]|uniref:NAC domain-containing protein n=1 Tax=Escallonia rubra TaxID=112253 RepID=A0AA88QPH1_9ASTE|nr:hypothetical protein RJ640_000803 [Escallonia rubra]
MASDASLATFLLIQISPGIVSSVDDIYDYEPHELPALAFKHGDRKMYFFTSLSKKYANDNKVKRDVKGNRGTRKSMLCTVYYHVRKKESGAEGVGTQDPSPLP